MAWRGVRNVEIERDAAIPQHRLVAIGDPLEEIFHGDGFGTQPIAAPFQPRKIEQVPDDRFELVRLLFHDLQIPATRVLIERHVRHPERFDVAANRRQRGHQLV